MSVALSLIPTGNAKLASAGKAAELCYCVPGRQRALVSVDL